MTNAMTINPPVFGPGPVQGPALTQAFGVFYREVLARLDLRYPGNDFGGLGDTAQVLTSTGAEIPTWKDTGFPSVPNETVVGNVSGATAQAMALTRAQLTALVDLVTSALSGAIPAFPNDASKFFSGTGTYAVIGGTPSAEVGLLPIAGTADTCVRSDGAPALDVTISPTWSGTHDFDNALKVGGVSQPIFAAPHAGYGTPTNNALHASFDATAITLPQLAAVVAQLIIDLKAGSCPPHERADRAAHSGRASKSSINRWRRSFVSRCFRRSASRRKNVNALAVPPWDLAPEALSWAQKVAYLAAAFKQLEQVETPLEHRFEPGWYVRTMRIPAQTLFIGRRHQKGHEVILLEGEAIYIDPTERHYVKPPFSVKTPAGFYAVVFAITDVVGETRHPNPDESRDVAALELEAFEPAAALIARGEDIQRRLLA